MTAFVLPAEVEASLELFSQEAPGPASRARASLELLLGELADSVWPDAIWRFSTLTGDGFPLEFSFTSEGEIRYAAECAPPETPETERLDRGVALLRRLGMPSLNADILANWRSLQSHGPLRYGAFVGVRHGRGPDRFKLYVELPPSCSSSDLPGRNDIPGEPIMIGHDPDSLRTEVYFRCRKLAPGDLPPLMAGLGLSARAPDLLRLIEDVWGRPAHKQLPGPVIGVSTSESPGGRNAFAIFTYASALFATDLAIRNRVLTIAAGRGWEFSHYERLTRAFLDRQPETLAHTMLTYSVSRDGSPRLDVGLRPVV